MRSLIFANGSPDDGMMVRQALADAQDALVIAADGGVQNADYFGREVHLAVGDMDSISPQMLEKLRADQIEVIPYSAEKNETDLELALQWAVKKGADWIRIIGGLGGRFDQTLANIYLLALPELEACDVRVVAGGQAIWLLRPGTTYLHGAPGDTISLIPISGPVHGIITKGLHYPLRGDTLFFGPARGISNVLSAEVAEVGFEEGLLLVVHTIGRA